MNKISFTIAWSYFKGSPKIIFCAIVVCFTCYFSLNLNNSLVFISVKWVWEMVCYTCWRGWRGWRVCVSGVVAWVTSMVCLHRWRARGGSVLAWVAWVACFRGWHASALAWVAWVACLRGRRTNLVYMVDMLAWVTW